MTTILIGPGIEAWAFFKESNVMQEVKIFKIYVRDNSIFGEPVDDSANVSISTAVFPIYLSQDCGALTTLYIKASTPVESIQIATDFLCCCDILNP